MFLIFLHSLSKCQHINLHLTEGDWALPQPPLNLIYVYKIKNAIINANKPTASVNANPKIA